MLGCNAELWRRADIADGTLVGQSEHDGRAGVDEVPGGTCRAGTKQASGTLLVGLVDREVVMTSGASDLGVIFHVAG
jgi:hypothetical protein